MTHGARLNKLQYLLPMNRKTNFKKCAVCEKALHENNKIGLCSLDYSQEMVLNYRFQGFQKMYRDKYRLRQKNNILKGGIK